MVNYCECDKKCERQGENFFCPDVPKGFGFKDEDIICRLAAFGRNSGGYIRFEGEKEKKEKMVSDTRSNVTYYPSFFYNGATHSIYNDYQRIYLNNNEIVEYVCLPGSGKRIVAVIKVPTEEKPKQNSGFPLYLLPVGAGVCFFLGMMATLAIVSPRMH